MTTLTLVPKDRQGPRYGVLPPGSVSRVDAPCEVVLSLGAINTPKILTLSGIGDERELRTHSSPVHHHLPGWVSIFRIMCRLTVCGSTGNRKLLGTTVVRPSSSDPDELKTAVACVEWCREVDNAAPLSPYTRREVMPGKLKGAELEQFVRNAATTFVHQCGTAKMGRDELSVVDGRLRVYGYDNLRVADASIVPRIATTNTMAPYVVIGERSGRSPEGPAEVM